MRASGYRGLLGGTFGLLGALPLLGVARGIALLFGSPARLPGVELRLGDLKAATWAEVAAIVLALPAATLFFGLVLPRFLERRTGRWFEWPGVAFAVSLPLFRSGVPASASVAAGLGLAAAIAVVPVLGRKPPPVPVAGPVRPVVPVTGHEKRARWPWLAAALLLLFVGSWRFYDQLSGDVDLLEDGQILGPAQVYLAGGRPYVDTYPIHGWGADGGVNSCLFRISGPSLETFRTGRAALTALAVSCLGAACFAVFESVGWSAVAFLLALSISPFASERQVLAFAALAVLAAAARRGHPLLWLAAGAVSAWTLFDTLDLGLIVLAGGLLTTVFLAALDRNVRGATCSAILFLAGGAAGALPFVVLLARHRALAAFARTSFLEIPATISDVWGLPAGTARSVVAEGTASEAFALLARGEGMPSAFLLALLGVAVGVLLGRILEGRGDLTDRGAAAALAVTLVALRGALGRADVGHLTLYGVFAGLPAAWLIYRAAHAARWKVALTVAVVVALGLRLRPDRALRTEWAVLTWRADPEESVFRASAPRSGRATVSPAQSGQLWALRAFLDANLAPGETFFDYGSEPALSFLMDRLPPVRYPIVAFYENEPGQREVIAALERTRPPLALLDSGSLHSRPDGVPNRDRTPLVAAYLDRTYEPFAEIAGRTFGRRRDLSRGAGQSSP